jgi:hypothetical protein
VWTVASAGDAPLRSGAVANRWTTDTVAGATAHFAPHFFLAHSPLCPMEYLVYIDDFDTSPKKLVEADSEDAAREHFRRTVTIYSRPFLELVYERTGPGSWITLHLARSPHVDGPHSLRDVRRQVASRIPAFDGCEVYARRYRSFYFGAPAGLRPSNPEDLHWLVQKYPFPDEMLLLMEEALEGHGDAGGAPVEYTTLDADRLRAGMDVQEVPAMHDRFR